jgi:adenylate cyclase
VTPRKPPPAANEEFWREFLTRGDSKERVARRIFKRIPQTPRCRLCAAPFAGIGAPLMRLIGKRQSDMNPNWCNSCSTFMRRHHGGAEVEGTMLFADIRGSTSLAERMSPAEFHHLLDRFYTTATNVIFEYDGAVDKFVGDELVAMFFPLLSGERHTLRAVEAAQGLLRATGHTDPAGPWVPLGVGIHTGMAWFGAVGEGTHVELTALGDVVNTTARVASAAAVGEILVTEDAAVAAGLDPTLERTTLELKGKRLLTKVVTLRVDSDIDPTRPTDRVNMV